MNRTERIARIHRDLVELRSRLGRIEGEVFSGKRNVDELVAELAALDAPVCTCIVTRTERQEQADCPVHGPEIRRAAGGTP